MKISKGTDDFTAGVFNKHEWSAPYLETPEEILNCFNCLDVIGKKLEYIRAIGVNYEDITNGSGEYMQMGILLGEPLILMFTDGSSLEIQMLSCGRMRMSNGCIPWSVVDGLNHTNFDANMLAGENRYGQELAGKKLKAIEYTRKAIEEDHWTYKTSEKQARCEKQYDYDYICRLVFDDDRSVALFDKGSGIYSAIVCRNYSLKPELVTKEVYASYYKKSDTAILVEGDMRGGGLAIAPFKFDPSNVIFPGQRNHDEEIYIEEEDSVEYLLPFLEEFYDHELNNKFRLDYFGEYSPYGDCFEWYGTPNLYSFSGIEHLIRHITEFTDRTPPEYYGSEINNAGSDARIAAINKYNRAMDFYRRICYLLGVMINNADGYDNIAVCGP